MTIKPNSSHRCPGKKEIPRDIPYNEGFKIIRKDFGCNYVEDRTHITLLDRFCLCLALDSF